MLRSKPAVTALALTAIVVSGCGSSKGGSSATSAASTTAPATTPATNNTTPTKLASGAPLPRAQWIAAGDVICARTLAKLATLVAHTKAATERDLSLAAVYAASEAEELSKIVPPKQFAQDWEQIVNDVHVYGEFTATAARSVNESHGTVSPTVLAKVETFRADMLARARRAGFKQCSRAA